MTTLLPTVNGETLRPGIDLCEQLKGNWAILPQLMPTQIAAPAMVKEIDAREVNLNFDRLTNGIAHIQLRGPMTKQGFGPQMDGSTLLARVKIDAALKDDSVRGVLLSINSPGGTVNGTKELADAVANLSANKPVVVFAEDIVASAAYWVASQADAIVMNQTGLAGSIGTYMMVYDFSQLFEKFGIKAHMISSGGFKGAGALGTEITEDQVAEWQRVVMSLNDVFLSSVADGRREPRQRIEQLADGRVHVAKDALALGLVDAVGSFPAAVSTLEMLIDRRANMPRTDIVQGAENTSSPGQQAGVSPVSTGQATAQPQLTTAPQASQEQPATLDQLKALAGDDNDFIVSQLGSGATLTTAQSAWSAKQSQTIAELRAQLAAGQQPAQQQAPPAAPQVQGGTVPVLHGTQPIANGGSEPASTGTASKQLPENKTSQKAIVDAKIAEIRQRDGGNFSYATALQEIYQESPELFNKDKVM